jgi:hypothetical protein
MQIKTSHIRTVKRKNIEAIKGWQWHTHTLLVGIQMVPTLWKIACLIPLKVNMQLVCNTIIAFLGIYPPNWKITFIHKAIDAGLMNYLNSCMKTTLHLTKSYLTLYCFSCSWLLNVSQRAYVLKACSPG